MFKLVYKWLAQSDLPVNTDLIFVLAGLEKRKTYALELFHSGFAPQVLFSTARYEIRRFVNLPLPQRIDLLKIVESIPPPMRHFLVHVTTGHFEVQRIPAKGLGTLREIEALARWLKTRPGINSLLIVSSAIHLRRLRLCSRALLPRSVKVLFIATPAESQRREDSERWMEPSAWKSVVAELVKILCYSIVLPFLPVLRNSGANDDSGSF